VPSRYGDEDQLIMKDDTGPIMIRCTSKLSAILKDNLGVIVRGSWLKITYTADVPTTKGNPMKDYDVDVEPPTAARQAQLAAEEPSSDNFDEPTPF
jgi:hypothetical protein